MNDVIIIPAILATTGEEYKKKLEKIESSPELAEGWVQVDLIDGKFTDNISVGADVLAKYPTRLNLEAHLMVLNPEPWIRELIKIGVKRVVFPVEGAGIEEKIKHLKNHQVQAGLSVNPETEVEKVLPFLDTIDVVLLLSVHPGFSGQEFKPEVLGKIKQLAGLRGTRQFQIEVDGGLNEGNVQEVVLAGADNLVLGKHLLEGNVTENLENIWEAIRG